MQNYRDEEGTYSVTSGKRTNY